MPSVGEILHVVGAIAPAHYAFPGDPIGLQVGRPEASVTRAVVTLDRSLSAVRWASKVGAELVLAHHPLIYHPMRALTPSDHQTRTVLELAERKIAFIAAHTNWDAAQGGVNDALGSLLGLTDLRPFGDSGVAASLKLVAFVPPSAVDKVVDAASAAGAGLIGAYSRCAFLSEGFGTFEAGADARPSVGGGGARERVAEVRVEMVLPVGTRQAVEAAVRAAHPYEEPALDFVVCADKPQMPTGRVGQLPASLPLAGWVQRVDQALGTRSLAWGNPARSIQRVAVVGGAADSQWRHAQASGADCLVTGEVAQHVALEAVEEGFCLLCSGHYATEQPGVVALARRMAESVPEVNWLVFEPSPGEAGRPL